MCSGQEWLRSANCMFIVNVFSLILFLCFRVGSARARCLFWMSTVLDTGWGAVIVTSATWKTWWISLITTPWWTRPCSTTAMPSVPHTSTVTGITVVSQMLGYIVQLLIDIQFTFMHLALIQRDFHSIQGTHLDQSVPFLGIKPMTMAMLVLFSAV